MNFKQEKLCCYFLCWFSSYRILDFLSIILLLRLSFIDLHYFFPPKVDDLTPQVTTAAKIVFQDPGNQAAQEHFDLMKKRWMDNMERLRGLVDEAVDSSALIKAEGGCNQLV